MIWSAFVATDLQLALISTCLTFLYTKFSKFTQMLTFMSVILGTAIYSFLLYLGNYRQGYYQLGDASMFFNFTIRPYVRLDSYFMGMMVAIYYQKIVWFQEEARLKEKLQHPFLNWTHKSHVAAFLFLILASICFYINAILYANPSWYELSPD